MSGTEVLGSISGVITIIQSSIKIFDKAQKDFKLPTTFEAVGHRLPIILDTLQICENDLSQNKDLLSAQNCLSLETTLDKCDVLIGEKDTWAERYTKVIKRLGKGSEVEELILFITQDVQVVVNNHLVRSVKQERRVELENIVKEMEALRSSIPEEQHPGITINNSGTQANHLANNSGSRSQTNYTSTGGTQNVYELFIGRHYELDEMKRVLNPGNKFHGQRRLVLGGVGGIGKTQLAIAYANRYLKNYTSIFWLKATSETTLKDSFRLIAESIFSIQALEDLKLDLVVAEVRRWLSYAENNGWLLLIDNYDEPSQFEIEKYYPYSTQGSIIITTRLPDHISGTIIRVRELLSTKESLQILKTRSGRMGIEDDPFAEQLAERLQGFPLVLATAGAYLRNSNITFERYLQEYEDRWNIGTSPPLREYQHCTLYTAWGLSYISLQNNNPKAAKLLKLLAYFDNQNIWFSLLRDGLSLRSPDWLCKLLQDEFSFDSVMRSLAEYSFLEPRVEQQVWSMHVCVHDWTLAELNKTLDPREYWFAFDCIAESDTPDNSLMTHLDTSMHALWITQPRFDHIYNNVGYHFTSALRIGQMLLYESQFEVSERLLCDALQGYENTFGPEHELTFIPLNSLAQLYSKEGNLANVEEIYRCLLQRKNNIYGPEDISTLNSLSSLADICYFQGKLAMAKEMHQCALLGYKKAFGPKNLKIFWSISRLSIIDFDQGNLAGAKEKYQQVLKGYWKEYTSASIPLHDVFIEIADRYYGQGELAKAEERYQHALQGRKEPFGIDHILTAHACNILGAFYGNLGKLAQAEDMYQRILQGYNRPFDQSLDFLGVAIEIVENLGLLYTIQGEMRKAHAMSLNLQALQDLETSGGPHEWSKTLTKYLSDWEKRRPDTI
ncbi:hypothetical protein FQN57_002142 [Myotisia sp. PD_48]|nr:hypothetical protein FQN57_002142 [Myotisia sp. PD_48]